jgi:hypothetical protein
VQPRDPYEVVLQALEPLVRRDHFLDILLEYPAIFDVLWMRDFVPNVHRLFEVWPALIPDDPHQRLIKTDRCCVIDLLDLSSARK